MIIPQLNRKCPRHVTWKDLRLDVSLVSLSKSRDPVCLREGLRLYARPDLWGYDREDPVFPYKCSFHWGGPDSRSEFLAAIMTLEQAPLRVPQFSLVIVVPPTAPFSSSFSEALLQGQTSVTWRRSNKSWFLKIGEYQIEMCLQLYLQYANISPLYIFLVFQTSLKFFDELITCKIQVFWDFTTCWLAYSYRRSGIVPLSVGSNSPRRVAKLTT